MARVFGRLVVIGYVAFAAAITVPSVGHCQAPPGADRPAQPPAVPPKAEPQPDLINPDRPGLADGSNVVGKHRFQIEIGVQQEFRKDNGVSTRTTFIPTLLRFGMGDKWEGRIEGNNFTFVHTSDPMLGGSDSSGLAPFSYGFKYHFQDQTAPGKRASLGTIFRLFPASGSGGFGTNHTTGDLRLVADWALSDQWSLNPNAGIAIYEDGSGRTFTAGLAALTLNYNPNPRVNPFVDMGFQGPEERNGRSSLILDAGLAFITSRNIQLDVSLGTGALGKGSPHPFWSAGVSARF